MGHKADGLGNAHVEMAGGVYALLHGVGSEGTLVCCHISCADCKVDHARSSIVRKLLSINVCSYNAQLNECACRNRFIHYHELIR